MNRKKVGIIQQIDGNISCTQWYIKKREGESRCYTRERTKPKIGLVDTEARRIVGITRHWAQNAM